MQQPDNKSSVQRDTTKQLYSAIKQEHQRLMSIKENGVQKYHDEWIIRELANKYFKSPATIEKIIYNRI